GRALRDPVPTTPVSEEENSPWGRTRLILRTCRNYTGVLSHPFHRILASVQNLIQAGVDLLDCFGGGLKYLTVLVERRRAEGSKRRRRLGPHLAQSLRRLLALCWVVTLQLRD